MLEQNRNTEFYVTEKLEGKSATYLLKEASGFISNLLNKASYVVCSRAMSKCYPDGSIHWIISKELNIEKRLRKVYDRTGIRYAIQGEIIGVDTRKNIYKRSGLEFYMFNAWNLTESRRVTFAELEELRARLGLDMVPVLCTNIVFTEQDTVDTLLDYSNGISKLSKVAREGVVFRSHDMKIGFKVRSPKYLLKIDPELEE